MKRVFLIVLDSVGIGALPDAAEYGDTGASTMRSISKSPKFSAETMIELGLSNIEGIDYLGACDIPKAAYGRMAEVSKGKDTTIGHWEMAGIISPKPMPTYPEGFPEEIIAEFSRQTGRGVLCNKPYSGTEVIKAYGEEHIATGDLIVYTSADSVFQIAAHEEVVPPEQLYEYCRIARKILQGEHGVGRVIARPFIGSAGNFTRTSNRHDFSLEPYGKTMLDVLKESGKDVIAVGKITDVFVGRGITKSVHTSGNTDGMNKTAEIVKKDFNGLCFVNLVDFDMIYGHRQDVDGYAAALAEFDSWLKGFIPKLRADDMLIITADHGCDPGDDSTDHTREHVPLLVYGKNIKPVPLGTRESFSDIACSVCDWLGVKHDLYGTSFISKISDKISYEALVEKAKEAMQYSYSPYSDCKVGAALLTKSGKIYLGCNVENAAFSPTNCAERTAFFKAVSEGEREFECIAVVGGKNGIIDEPFAPCGVCRQVMMEFCDSEKFRVIIGTCDGYEVYTLKELLPLGFSKGNVK